MNRRARILRVARFAGPFVYAGVLTACTALSWLEPPSTGWRFLCCCSWVAAAVWYSAFRIERAHRKRIARLAAREAVERGRPFGSIDGREIRRLTPQELADAYWMN